MSLVPLFTQRLGHRIERGLATIGKFDGVNSALAFATTGGKIAVYMPTSGAIAESAAAEVVFLNVNEKLTALCAGRFHPDHARDLLAFGTRSLLVGYDVHTNADVLSKDVEDGVHSIVVGRISTDPTPLILIGGSYSLQGFDHAGNERFWTVCGDNVTALTLCDVEGDGIAELLAGSEDYEIRIYKGDAVISEITESNRIVELTDITKMQYGFALADGSLGVYRGAVRAWRVVTGKTPTAQTAFDLNGDGAKELITGYSDGSFDVRRTDTGECMYTDKLDSEVAKLLVADLRGDGTMQLICCAASGLVVGYRSEDPTSGSAGAAVFARDGLTETVAAMQIERDALTHKIALYKELAHKAYVASIGKGTSIAEVGEDTVVNIGVGPDYAGRCLRVTASVSTPGLVVAAMIVSAPQLLEGGLVTVCLDVPEPTLSMSLQPRTDAIAGLMVTALVGPRGMPLFRVYERELQFPKFGILLPVDGSRMVEPRSGVVVPFAQRTSRLCAWFASRFIFENYGFPDAGDVTLFFASLRDGSILSIKFFEAKAKLHIRTDSLALAGDLIQDLAAFHSITDLQTQAEFPAQMAAFAETASAVEALHATRAKMSSSMAETAALIKVLAVRAEDARITGDMQGVRRAYLALSRVNRDVLGEHAKRESNHAELVRRLKGVGTVIQEASRLRVGKPAADMLTACRAALKDSNIAAVLKIIAVGSESL